VSLNQAESGLAGADLAVVATNLSQAQLANQATLSATARVLGLPTLLDYLKKSDIRSIRSLTTNPVRRDIAGKISRICPPMRFRAHHQSCNAVSPKDYGLL
jgi:multidrug efflux pump subunit AcrA (membrane-fusion protein)